MFRFLTPRTQTTVATEKCCVTTAFFRVDGSNSQMKKIQNNFISVAPFFFGNQLRVNPHKKKQYRIFDKRFPPPEYWPCYSFQTMLIFFFLNQSPIRPFQRGPHRSPSPLLRVLQRLSQKRRLTLLWPLTRVCVMHHTHWVSVGDLGAPLGRRFHVRLTVRTLPSSCKPQSQIKSERC